jgi:hypothetical protein
MKTIFFSDHLKKCVIVANELSKDKDEILSGLYQIAINKAIETAKEIGKGEVFKEDLFFEVDKINNMFNMFQSDKDLKDLVLPAKNWFKDLVNKKFQKEESNNKQ